MNRALELYLENHIKPQYQIFDKAHQKDHVEQVIKESLEIAKDYNLNLDMVYTIACYHDIGLQFGRDDHHITGGAFLYNDKKLRYYFNEDEMKIMKEAIEDHRASTKEPPRSIYGMIIAEADRDINKDVIMLRTVQYGFKHYPDISMEEHIERAFLHMKEKYGPQGYLKLWLHTKKNTNGLKEIWDMLNNPEDMKNQLGKLYEIEKNDR